MKDPSSRKPVSSICFVVTFFGGLVMIFFGVVAHGDPAGADMTSPLLIAGSISLVAAAISARSAEAR